jgi:hypothetical protein
MKAFEEFNRRNGGNWKADWNDALGNPIAVFDGKYTKKKPIPNHFFEGVKITPSRPLTITASPLQSPVCDETGKVCLRKFDRSTDYFSPNGDGHLDEVEFSFTVLIKHTDALQSQGGGDVKRYFLTWALSIFDEKGKVVNEFSSFKEEILPPFDCVTWDLKPIERGKACHYVRKNMKTVWNGKDFGGKIQPDGAYYYTVYLLVEREDKLGNGGTMIKKVGEMRTERASVVLDTVPPFIVVSSPQYGALIQSKTPYFLIEFWDETSGILKESFRIFLDREEITSKFRVEENRAYFTPSEQLTENTHDLQVMIEDKAGNPAVVYSYFTIVSYEDIRTVEGVVAFLSELKDVYGFKENLEDLKIDKITKLDAISSLSDFVSFIKDIKDFEDLKFEDLEQEDLEELKADEIGSVFVSIIRLKQFFKEIPVETELIVMTDIEGDPIAIYGEYYVIPETFPTIPKLSPRDVLSRTLSIFSLQREELQFVPPIYYLTIIRDKNGILHLAYKILILSPWRMFWAWIDAFDGSLVATSDLKQAQLPQCTDWCGCICTAEQQLQDNMTACPANSISRVGFPDVTGQNLSGNYVRQVVDADLTHEGRVYCEGCNANQNCRIRFGLLCNILTDTSCCNQCEALCPGRSCPAAPVINEQDRDFCYDRNSHEFEMAAGYFWTTMAGRFFSDSGRFGARARQTTIETLYVDYRRYIAPQTFLVPQISLIDVCVRENVEDPRNAGCPNAFFSPFDPLRRFQESYNIRLCRYLASRTPFVVFHEYSHAHHCNLVRCRDGTLGELYDGFEEGIADYFADVMVNLYERQIYSVSTRTGTVDSLEGWASILGTNPNNYTFDNAINNRTFMRANLTVGTDRYNPHFDGGLWYSFLWRLRNRYGDIIDRLAVCAIEATGRNYPLNNIERFFRSFLDCTTGISFRGLRNEIRLRTIASSYLAGIRLKPISIMMNRNYMVLPSINNIKYSDVIRPIFYAFPGEAANYELIVSPNPICPWQGDQQCQDDMFILSRNNTPQLRDLNGNAASLRAEIVQPSINIRNWRFRRFIDHYTKRIRFFYTIRTNEGTFSLEGTRMPFFDVAQVPDNPPIADFNICESSLLLLFGFCDEIPTTIDFEKFPSDGVLIGFQGIFYDKDGDILEECEWDFGDGKTIKGSRTSGNQFACSVTSHRYNLPGEYTIKYRVKDTTGLMSSYAIKKITLRVAFYKDEDGDGYGNPNKKIFAPSQPPGYVANNLDCNDSDPSVHPGAPLYCGSFSEPEFVDNDCDGNVEKWYCPDLDGDGYGYPHFLLCFCLNSPVQGTVWTTPASLDCNDDPNDQYAKYIHPGQCEVCDGGVDNDCDGADESSDPDAGKCWEYCGNQIDDDCDGKVDENCGCAVVPETNSYLQNLIPLFLSYIMLIILRSKGRFKVKKFKSVFVLLFFTVSILIPFVVNAENTRGKIPISSALMYERGELRDDTFFGFLGGDGKFEKINFKVDKEKQIIFGQTTKPGVIGIFKGK